MKILIVRFSSIGDIVLTTPVLRCLKNQLNSIEIHYLLKSKYETVLSENPNIDKLITIEKSVKEIIPELKAEKYDYIIDLHHNIRTLRLKTQLGIKSKSFPKFNFKKWILVNLKRDKLPQTHVVNRYFQAVKFLNVENDNLKCDFFISEKNKVDVFSEFNFRQRSFVCFAIGAQFFTKRLPLLKMLEIVNNINQPIVLIGDRLDEEIAVELMKKSNKKDIKSACGSFSIQQSASIVQQSAVLLTHDTGMMHIASAFEIPTVSVWGNTVPAFGMTPYFPNDKKMFSVHEVQNISCRPCSKIGYSKCPKKHFNCMELQDSAFISNDVNFRFQSLSEK
jgi:ADP-heptose:LPS heptosyltransferase